MRDQVETYEAPEEVRLTELAVRHRLLGQGTFYPSLKLLRRLLERAGHGEAADRKRTLVSD